MDTQPTITSSSVTTTIPSHTVPPVVNDSENDVRHPKNKRWLIVATILMVVVVAGGIGYLVYQNSLLRQQLMTLETRIDDLKTEAIEVSEKKAPEPEMIEETILENTPEEVIEEPIIIEDQPSN